MLPDNDELNFAVDKCEADYRIVGSANFMNSIGDGRCSVCSINPAVFDPDRCRRVNLDWVLDRRLHLKMKAGTIGSVRKIGDIILRGVCQITSAGEVSLVIRIV